MVSVETIKHTIFTLGVAVGLIFLIFVVKIPVACTGCDSPVGVWYRCFSGGDGSNTCDTTTSGNFTNQVKEIVKELIDAGINLPKTIIDGVIYIKNKLVTLAVGIFDTIKAVLRDAYSTMSMVYNDYIKGPVVSGYTFIKDNVVLPIIQGVTDYIVRPIQDLIEKIIGLKDTVFRAIKSAFKITHDIAVEVFDVTYGALIYGFDQIPYGLVSFVETIQDVLNTLKNGIIGRVPANNIPTGGMNKALYKTLSGIQTAVNTVTGGANYVIDPVVNGIIDAVNVVSFGTANISRIENAIPKTYFADNYRSWIPNPADLFWAGTKSVPMSDIVSSVDAVCPLVCKSNGYDTGKQNTNPGKNKECICIKDVTLSNNNALLSCTDICSTVGGVSMLPVEGRACPVCSNEIIFPYNPFELKYSFVIAFENTPFTTLVSSIKYSTTLAYTSENLSTTLKTLLIEDIIKTLALKNIDILSQGQVPVSTLTFPSASVTPTPTPTPTPTLQTPTPSPTPMPTTATAFDASWLDITYAYGLYRLDFTPEATTQLAAIATALSLTTVGIDIVLSFSTNTLLAQSYGFTSDAKLSTNDTVTTTMTSTYTVPSTSSTVLSYLRTSGKSVSDLVRERDSLGNLTGNVIIPYPSTPIVSAVTPVNAFKSYRGYNFYYLNGYYFVVMNNTFYKLNDQTIPKSTDTEYKFIQLQSALNCASPFSLKPYPNPNAVKFTYMDKTLNFSEVIYFPACPIYKAKRTILMGADLDDAIKNGRPMFRTTFYHLAECSTSSITQNMADYYTQQTFFTTMAFLLWDKIDSYAGKIIHRTPPFIFTVTNGELSMELTTTAYDISGNIVYAPRDASGYVTSWTSNSSPSVTPTPTIFYDYKQQPLTPTNNPAVKLTASLTLHLSQYPIIAYNFNRKTDITITSMETITPVSYQLNAFDTPSSSIKSYGLGTTSDPSGNYVQFYETSGTLNTPSYKAANNFIVYEFKDILNEYAYTSTTILPIGTYTYDQIGPAFAKALANDINSNTDNFYNFNALTTTDDSGNLIYSNTVGETYSKANIKATITTNFIKFNMSVVTQDRPDANSNSLVCLPYLPSSTSFNVSIPSTYIEPNSTKTSNYKLYGEYIELTFDLGFSLGEYEIIPAVSSAYIRKDDSGNIVINKSNIDIYEVWIAGSNDGSTWYKVDNQTSIAAISYTPLINEQALVYSFKKYRVIVTRMLNTPTPYPSTYIINAINLYDSTFVKQNPTSYGTSPSITSTTLPFTLTPISYKNTDSISTFYQGQVYTPITIGAPPSETPAISLSPIIIDNLLPITFDKVRFDYRKLFIMQDSNISVSNDGSTFVLAGYEGTAGPLVFNDNGFFGIAIYDKSNSKTDDVERVDTSNTTYTQYIKNVTSKFKKDYIDYNAVPGVGANPQLNCITITGDGKIIFIGHAGSYTFTTDGGITFTSNLINGLNSTDFVTKIATSNDGTYITMMICESYYRFRGKGGVSDNALRQTSLLKYDDGNNNPSFVGDWHDRRYWYAKSLLLSNDSGVSWRKSIIFSPKVSPCDIAMSDDGRIQIVTVYTRATNSYVTPSGCSIYFSNNYGFTWKEAIITNPNSTVNIKKYMSFNIYEQIVPRIYGIQYAVTSIISMSNTGKYINIPILYTDLPNNIERSYVLTSVDYGTTWTANWPKVNSSMLYFNPVFPGSTAPTADFNDPTQSIILLSTISGTGQYQFLFLASITTIVVLQSFDYGLNYYVFFVPEFYPNAMRISYDATILYMHAGISRFVRGYKMKTKNIMKCPDTYTYSGTNNALVGTLTGSSITSINLPSSNSITVNSFYSPLKTPNNLYMILNNSNVYKFDSSVTTTPYWKNINTLYDISGGILPPYSYDSIFVSDSGNYGTIISKINGIYNSSDGKNWSHDTSTEKILWKFVKLSSSGRYGIACSDSNALYRSDNFGQSWGPIKIQSPAVNTYPIYNAIDMSITGQYQTIVTENAGVYYTNNFGKTWINTSWTTYSWTLVKVSATGQEQIVAGTTGIAYSSDYGNTFTKSKSNLASNFIPKLIIQSATGKYATIASNEYGLYSTFDYAQTWFATGTCGTVCTCVIGSVIENYVSPNIQWNFGCMSNYASLLTNGQIQMIEQDGQYQIFQTGTDIWYTSTYGLKWNKITNVQMVFGTFRYNFSNGSPTSCYFTGIKKEGDTLYNNSSTFPVIPTVTTNTFPDCFYSNITYTPSFTCNTQASNWNVRTAKITIKFSDSKMSSTLKYALGIQTAAQLDALALDPNNTTKKASDLILFDNPGIYKSTLPNTLFMFDPITPPFCGQDKEFKLPQAPNGLAYYFIGSGYAVTNTLTLPLNPIMDNYGTTQLGMSYSTSLIISTISYMLSQDIRSKTDGVANPTFNFFFNNSTKQLRLAFSSSYTTPATLVLRTSQNLIMSNAWGANGSDLYLSSNSIISYSPSVAIPGDDLINDMTVTTLNYRVIDTTGYAYAGRLAGTPANGNTVEYFVETILTRLLVNDINLKSSKKFNLSSNAFKFQVIKEYNSNQDRIIKTYNFDFNDPIPTLSIIIQFSKNEEWAKVLGITEDISVFNVNSSQIEVTDNISDNEIFDTYKGWYYYFFNNNYYFYISPYLLKMSQLPSPSSEILITADELKTYYSFNTSTNKEDVYYYNGNNDYYVLVDENFVYLIDFQTAINIGNGTPYSEGYIEKVSPDGFTYYNSPSEDWYVKGQMIDRFEILVDTMVQVNRTSLLLVTGNPNSVNYTYNSSTRSFNGTVTLPTGPFTPEIFATTLSGLLTKDIQTREPILDTAIQIKYEALTIDQQPTSQLYTFTIQNNTPFQLVLKCGTNSILASNLGVTSDIKINPIYPLVSTNLTAVITDPHSIAYQFIDSNYNFTRYITLPSSTPTPDELCTQLPLALITDINTYTGYPYTTDMMIMTYDTDTSKYTFTLYTQRPTTITLKFNESIGRLYQRTIPPSTWAKTLGCNATFTFSKTPTISPNAAVLVNPMILPYTFTDTASSTTYSSSITFKETAFNDSATGDSILNEFSTLLFTDINSKQQRYALLPTDLVINYDPSGKSYSFAVKSYAFSINLKFGASSLLGLNFGALSDITFSTLNPVLSSVPVNMTYDTYHTINMFMYQGQPSVFINTGTTSTSGLYALATGSDLCLNNMKCVERVLIDPNVSLAGYGYIVQPTGYYTKINAYVYDAKVQRLYLMLSTEVQKFYGSAEKNGFTVLTTCTLDSTGNCIPSSLNIIKLGNYTYVLLDKDVKTLLPFARDSVSEPSCPCHITANIIPTCNEVCSTKTSKNLNLPGGSNDPLLCANPNDDPLQTPCKCYYNGPVNVIVKPMQQYNPFRLLQSAFSSGGDSFLSGVANAVKGFMLPLWNTVKQVTAFLSSITAMIVEAITTYANPNYVFNLLKNLAVLGAQEAMDQLKSFWNETIKPGLEGLWAYRIVLIEKMKEGLSWVWENLKSALKALSVAISDIAVTVFGVVKSGLTYIWEKFSYYTSAIIDTITPFIPIGPTIKFNVFLWVMLIIIGAFIGVDELLITAYDTVAQTLRNASDSVGKVGGIFKSIVTGT